MDMQEGIKIIKEVAKENNFELTSGEKYFEVFKDKHHSVSFRVKLNDVNYLQVHQWEEDKNGGNYGRCIYSLRNINDIMKFCSLMIISSDIRAGR
ncbi:hypothetical protein [Sulfurimonas sp.]